MLLVNVEQSLQTYLLLKKILKSGEISKGNSITGNLWLNNLGRVFLLVYQRNWLQNCKRSPLWHIQKIKVHLHEEPLNEI